MAYESSLCKGKSFEIDFVTKVRGNGYNDQALRLEPNFFYSISGKQYVTLQVLVCLYINKRNNL